MTIKKLFRQNETYVFLILLALSFLIQVRSGQFYTSNNIVDIASAMIVPGLFAVGEFLVILSGGIDVSFPALASLTAYATTKLFLNLDYQGSVLLPMLTAIVIGAVLGMFNGFFVSFLRLPAMIVTLGTASVFKGIMQGTLESKQLAVIPAGMKAFGKQAIYTATNPVSGLSSKLPAAFLVFVGVLLLTFLVLRYTMFGRGIYAIGGNESAAYNAGFAVKRTKFLLYLFAGVIASVAGIIRVCMMQQCHPTNMLGMEMNIVAGVVLGGVFGVTLMLWICIQFYIFPLNFMSTLYFLFGLCQAATGYAAWITKKPVYYRNTRAEEFYANSTRHPMRVHVKMGGKKDGTITALFMEVCANTGPYGNHCLTVPMNSCSKTMPLFKVDNMAYDLKVYYTNTPPAGAYQGYGTPKGTYGIMMAMAELADKLGIDYRTMVEKNHVEEGYMLEILKGLGEGREGAVVPVGSCGLDEAIKQGCDMIDWGKKEVSDDPDWRIGKGFAMIMQGSGLPGLDHAEAIAKLETDGTVILNSGGADLGTGLDTISAKIVAEVLKLPMDRITVVSGDTDSCAFDTGAYASSGTFFSGNASLVATTKLKELILKEAALQMEEKVENLDVRAPGEVYSKDTGAALSYYDLVHTATSGTGRGQMVAHGSFVTNASSVPYGAHFAQVAVNVKTGEIKVQKFYALQDAGTPINPEIALCQMYGAVMKSIGHSLYEDMKLDKNGKCINANLTDYGAPMIDEAPEDFKSVLIDVDDKFGPYGAKSISEIACNGAAPAIGIAIHDACGVWLRSWPMTPEKVLKALGKI